MIANFFASIISWIIGLIAVVIVCVIAFPISMVGYAFNRGISHHLQISDAINKAQKEGNYIDWNKVKNYRASANDDLKGGFVGIVIMVVIYLLIFMFLPKFSLASLWGLIPFGIGLLGGFLIPDL